MFNTTPLWSGCLGGGPLHYLAVWSGFKQVSLLKRKEDVVLWPVGLCALNYEASYLGFLWASITKVLLRPLWGQSSDSEMLAILFYFLDFLHYYVSVLIWFYIQDHIFINHIFQVLCKMHFWRALSSFLYTDELLVYFWVNLVDSYIVFYLVLPLLFWAAWGNSNSLSRTSTRRDIT